MDTEQRDVEITEDDMGEGFVNPIDVENEKQENFFDALQRKQWKLEEKLRRKNAR